MEKRLGSKREEQTVKGTTTNERYQGRGGKNHKPLAFLPISE
jgi:hypothetical protein